MPNINIPVSQELLNRLTEHAFHARTTKADVVRDLIASLSGEGSIANTAKPANDANTANTAKPANDANTAKPAKRVGFDTASPKTNELLVQKAAKESAELQQRQAQPVAINPEPVAKHQSPSAFRAQIIDAQERNDALIAASIK